MSDKFVICTDSHLANQPPANRIDNYNESIIDKWEWVRDYCIKNKIDKIICPGDLCHTHRTNDELIYKFVSLFADSGINIYYLLGNHDIQGANTSFIYKTNMGLLAKYSWFHLLDCKDLYSFDTCYLTGINYSVEKETANAFHWWEGQRVKLDTPPELKAPVILVTHAMITNETMMIKGEAKSVSVHDVDTNADVLINGHYHIGHQKAVKRTTLEHDFMVINPGSMARMNLAEAEESYGPRIAVLTMRVGHNARYKFIDIPCKPIKEVFNRHKIHTKKSVKVDKDKFINSVRAMSQQNIMGDNFEQALRDIITNPPKKIRKLIKPSVRKILKKKLEEHCG